jgi:hypothetical protein
MAVELIGVHVLEIGDRLGLARPVQAGVQPGVLVALDDPGRRVVGVLVGVDVEPAVLVGPEDEGEWPEGLGRAEPHELGLAHVDGGLEAVGIGLADERVDAVGADQQIGVAVAVDVGDVGLVVDTHAERLGALLQKVQQSHARDAAEAMARGPDRAVAVAHLDGVPVGELAGDALVALRIEAEEMAQRRIREHHPEAERVVRPVALEDMDLVGRIGLLHHDAEIKPGRPGADDVYFQRGILPTDIGS